MIILVTIYIICFIVDFGFFVGMMQEMFLANEIFTEIADNLNNIRGFL